MAPNVQLAETMNSIAINRKTDPELALLLAAFHVEKIPISEVSESAPSTIKLKNGSQLEGVAACISYLAEQCQPQFVHGTSAEDEAEIQQWMTYAWTTIAPAVRSEDPSAQKAFAKFLNEALPLKVYFVGHSLSAADLVIYAHSHPYVAKMTEKRRFEMCHFVRWFDFIQHSEEARSFSALPMIDLNLDAPAEEETPAAATAPTAGEDQKKGKNSKADKKKGADESATKENKTDNAADKKPKEKKEKAPKEKKEKKPAAPAVEELPVWNPVRLDIRIGRIVDVKQHENADSLYVEQINLGEEQPRTIVSGLVKHIPIDQMKGSWVAVLCNLKPASMRGVKSEGMVLCATGPDGKVELLKPPENSQPGDRVYFDGFQEGTPDAVLNPKKKVWETIQPTLFTGDDLLAGYKLVVEGQPEKICLMRTAKGVIKSSTTKQATIK